VLIDIDNPTRDMMQELTLASGPLERTVAMFVSGDAGGLARTAIEAGVSAYVVDGLARAARCPVNVVDQPDLCDMTTPALVDRDPVVAAIGSEGTAPVLTREIKTRLERMLPGNLGGLAALAGRLRADVSARVPRPRRRAFWAWVFKGAPARRLGPRQGTRRRTRHQGRDRPRRPPARGPGGPGARDLLTLRAVEHLQEADVIFHDRLVDPDVLELARCDAERVYVGKMVAPHRRALSRLARRLAAGRAMPWQLP
jgi:uroporphyrin-III C-methyltransferase/precorrin-2 dehydrogenase/sirohydrochlorin ferrochelatase